jgi:RNA polymerase sigma factor (sigma-70 family)
MNIDEKLFPKIAANDTAAFEELYRLTERSVYAYVIAILRNHEDALDVLQETYLKIRGAAHLYRPLGKPMAWIFTIARNLTLTKIRTRRQNNVTYLEQLDNNLAFSYVTNSEDKLILETALNILNQQEREIILLHAVSGLKHAEIATNLGIPLSTVISKYHRGLKKMAKHLTAKEGIQ